MEFWDEKKLFSIRMALRPLMPTSYRGLFGSMPSRERVGVQVKCFTSTAVCFEANSASAYSQAFVYKWSLGPKYGPIRDIFGSNQLARGR